LLINATSSDGLDWQELEDLRLQETLSVAAYDFDFFAVRGNGITKLFINIS
jgi:hypothetical protein